MRSIFIDNYIFCKRYFYLVLKVIYIITKQNLYPVSHTLTTVGKLKSDTR